MQVHAPAGFVIFASNWGLSAIAAHMWSWYWVFLFLSMGYRRLLRFKWSQQWRDPVAGHIVVIVTVCIALYSQLLYNCWVNSSWSITNEGNYKWTIDSQDQSSPCQLQRQTHNDCNQGQCPSFHDGRNTCNMKPTTNSCSMYLLSSNKLYGAEWWYHYHTFHGCNYWKCWSKGNDKWSMLSHLAVHILLNNLPTNFCCYIAYHVEGFLVKSWCNNNPLSSWIPF